MQNLEIQVPQTLFDHPTGVIPEINVKTESQILGETSVITFEFNITTEIPSSTGFIKIKAPVWTNIFGNETYAFDELSLSC